MLTRNTPSLVIMAAGLGKRFGGGKTLCELGPHGEALFEYSIYDAYQAGFRRLVLIIRAEMQDELVTKITAKLPHDLRVKFVFQESNSGNPAIPPRTQPWGTGHALLQAAAQVDGAFCLINADDYYGASSLQQAFNYLNTMSSDKSESLEFALIAFPLVNTLSGFGGVNRGICQIDRNSKLITIEEIKELRLIQEKVQGRNLNQTLVTLDADVLVSMNCWLLDTRIFPLLQRAWSQFISDAKHWATCELMLPSVICELIQQQGQVVNLLPSDAEWFGLTFIEDKSICAQKLQHKINNNEYPQSLYAGG